MYIFIGDTDKDLTNLSGDNRADSQLYTYVGMVIDPKVVWILICGIKCIPMHRCIYTPKKKNTHTHRIGTDGKEKAY